MMMRHGRMAAAGALLCFAVGQTASAKAPSQGHDPGRAQALAGLPVHVVLLNDRLRSQVAYQYSSVASDVTQSLAVNQLLAIPGVSMAQAAAGGVVGGLIAGALIQAAEKQAALNVVLPADAELRASHCDLSQTQALSDAVARAVGGTSWGGPANVETHVLASGQELSEVVPRGPRYEFTLTYSMAPDYSAVMTSLNALVYSTELDGSGGERAKDPAWVDQLVVVSDLMPVAPKTPADIEAAVAAEMERYRTSEAMALIRKANAGDRDARKDVLPLINRHKGYLKSARLEMWGPVEIAAQRARLWSADDCAPLRAALESNTRELEQMLGMLFQGGLPPRMDKAPREPVTQEIGERRVIAQPGGTYVMTRGEAVPLAFRYSWLPDPGA